MRISENTEQFQFTLRWDVPEEAAVIRQLLKLPQGRRGAMLRQIVMQASSSEPSAESSRPRSVTFDDDGYEVDNG